MKIPRNFSKNAENEKYSGNSSQKQAISLTTMERKIDRRNHESDFAAVRAVSYLFFRIIRKIKS
nr:MAG TPA: hypothetical protein [Caudoviricetes sp.]